MRQAYYLLMNDLHVSVNNIAEFRKNWKEAFEVCKEYDITHIVIGGDIFTAQASQTLPVLMAVHEMFTFGLAQGIHFDVAAGNHDKVDKDDFKSYCHLYVHNDVNIIDDYDIFYSDKCVLAVMSYFPENGSFKQHLDELIEELKARVTQADNDYNSLKMARMLEITDGNLDEAKERLSRMIRQVNKCIAILSDEQ